MPPCRSLCSAFRQRQGGRGTEIQARVASRARLFTAKKLVWAIVVHAFEKVRERRETRVAPAAVIESARAHEGKLGAMEREFIDLAVIKLAGADELRRREEFETALAQPAVCREAGMGSKPARDRRRIDSVAMTGGQAATGFFEGMAAIVCRERIKDLVERIGFVAQSAGAGRKSAVARLAAIQPDRFELLGTAALRSDVPTAAGRTALRRLDGRAGFRGCLSGRA